RWRQQFRRHCRTSQRPPRRACAGVVGLIARTGVDQASNGRGRIVVAFDDNRLTQELFGEFDQNLAAIEQRLGVEAVARGNQVTLVGSDEALVQARLALDTLYHRLQSGHSISPGDVDGALRIAAASDNQMSLPSL